MWQKPQVFIERIIDMVKAKDLKLPLTVITPTTDFVVCGQRKCFVYGDDNKSTGEVEAIKSEVFDGHLKDRFEVKIPGKTELPFDEEKVFSMEIHINLINPTIGVYSRGKEVGLSIKADDWRTVKSTSKTQTISGIDSVL